MEKLEWLGYPMVKKISKISLFVSAQLTNVTDGRIDTHTHTQTLHADIGRAYASHRAANGLRFQLVRDFDDNAGC